MRKTNNPLFLATLAFASKPITTYMNYENFKLDISEGVASVAFNRPEKANALNRKGWDELRDIFNLLNGKDEVRAIVLSGEGKHFCSGIDLEMLMSVQQYNNISCEGRKREALFKLIKDLQSTITAIEECRKPVLAAIDNGCIGGGLDIISACDMRYCTEDGYFTIKEIDMGMVADLGTLQRLPKILNPGIVSEMAYTGRKVHGKEALAVGLVNRVYSSKQEMLEEVNKIARLIASKSPLSVRGTKEMLLYSRDNSLENSLNYMAVWNAGMFLSSDLMAAFKAATERKPAVFED